MTTPDSEQSERAKRATTVTQRLSALFDCEITLVAACLRVDKDEFDDTDIENCGGCEQVLFIAQNLLYCLICRETIYDNGVFGRSTGNARTIVMPWITGNMGLIQWNRVEIYGCSVGPNFVDNYSECLPINKRELSKKLEDLKYFGHIELASTPTGRTAFCDAVLEYFKMYEQSFKIYDRSERIIVFEPALQA